ncbi:MAG: hypothetical protein IPQ27_10450 [Chitinophagaceae bacterium]|nr:hypothetical protein [Chitinophagaceae bacterium]MBL0255341.1 hypothetical protein [Chitinophagaceae bacterium]HRB31449.1 hypothetical protein [Ferruginibacter sp.]
MALEEFDNDELNKRDRGYARMRSIMDLGMGLLWTAMGVFLFFNKYFETRFDVNLDDSTMKLLGGICIIYGVFRVYRGVKQNYFRKN